MYGLGLAGLWACTPTLTTTPPLTTTPTPRPTGVQDDTAAGPTGEPQREPGWAELAPLVEPLQENGVVVLDGEIVVLGGYDASVRIVDRVEAYDPSTNSWRALAPLPEALHHPNAAVVQDKIYVVGALGTGFAERAVTYIYDPGADTWSEGTPPPADGATGAAGVGVLDGVIHVVGGLSFNRTVALHSTYDPATDSWAELPDAPVARDHLAAGVVGTELVLVAGRDGGLSAFVDATWIYDGSGWRQGAPIPTPRGGVVAAAGPDLRLHVLGGEGGGGPAGVFATHEAYDPNTDTWTPLADMRTPRHGTGAAWADGLLYVPGGAQIQAFGADDTHEAWTL